jgi:hypothetical protein
MRAGLSLIELGTGNFPIPVETPPPPLVPIRQPPRLLAEADQRKRPAMAIFEMISYVVEGEPARYAPCYSLGSLAAF